MECGPASLRKACDIENIHFSHISPNLYIAPKFYCTNDGKLDLGLTLFDIFSFFFQDLSTNTGEKHCDGVYYDKCMTGLDNDGINIKKGEMFGEFNLGSTIVLIFEAPDNFNFKINKGQKVMFGQPFGLSN